jgi:tRNA modification GTPase
MSVVFALATPPAKSAICVFRVSGSGCLKKLEDLFNKEGFGFGRFYVNDLFHKKNIVDRVGLVVFKGPNSYTGEDSFEVYAHGGLGVMSSIVRAFKDVGFDEAPGGEFTKRAFLNNKISLNEAEAVSDLIDSTDERGVVLSSKSLFGELSKKVVSFSDEIDSIRVRVEGDIDFSDEDNEYIDGSLVKDLKNLCNRFDSFVAGCVNKKFGYEKNRILLIGPVNSGKSSVFNRLLGFERALVSNTPGTTRDLISSELFYEASSFSVFDSAGIRDTKDRIEEAGIAASLSQINDADLVLMVFEDYDLAALDRFKGLCGDKPFINIQNKIDINKPNNNFDCCVSAKSGAGFDVLKSLIVSAFDVGAKKDDFNFIIRDRHETLFKQVVLDLSKSLAGLSGGGSIELVAEDLKNARSHLDEMVGKKFSDSLLGDIFNDFCIGK